MLDQITPYAAPREPDGATVMRTTATEVYATEGRPMAGAQPDPVPAPDEADRYAQLMRRADKLDAEIRSYDRLANDARHAIRSPAEPLEKERESVRIEMTLIENARRKRFLDLA